MRPPAPWRRLSSPPMAAGSITKPDCTCCCTRGAYSLSTGWETSAFQSSSAGSGRKKILIRKVRILSDGRKTCPNLNGSMGNVSIIELCTWIESRRLSLISLWSVELHINPTKTQTQTQTLFTRSSHSIYLLLLLLQPADRPERKPGKKKRVFPWSQEPNRTASCNSCRRKDGTENFLALGLSVSDCVELQNLNGESWGSEWFYRKRPELECCISVKEAER